MPSPPKVATGKLPASNLRPEYKASFASVLRALVNMRAGGSLLHEPEWAAYRHVTTILCTSARLRKFLQMTMVAGIVFCI